MSDRRQACRRAVQIEPEPPVETQLVQPGRFPGAVLRPSADQLRCLVRRQIRFGRLRRFNVIDNFRRSRRLHTAHPQESPKGRVVGEVEHGPNLGEWVRKEVEVIAAFRKFILVWIVIRIRPVINSICTTFGEELHGGGMCAGEGSDC